MKVNLFLITEAARRFTKVLHQWLTFEQMQRVRELNLTYEAGVCASHDFCDANMAMDEAWNSLGIDPLETEKISETESCMSDAMVTAWNMAWDIARGCEFDTAEIDQWLERRKEAAVEAALNAACLSIQVYIGQDDGGPASLFFSGSNEDSFKELMMGYINYEQVSMGVDYE